MGQVPHDTVVISAAISFREAIEMGRSCKRPPEFAHSSLFKPKQTYPLCAKLNS